MWFFIIFSRQQSYASGSALKQHCCHWSRVQHWLLHDSMWIWFSLSWLTRDAFPPLLYHEKTNHPVCFFLSNNNIFSLCCTISLLRNSRYCVIAASPISNLMTCEETSFMICFFILHCKTVDVSLPIDFRLKQMAFRTITYSIGFLAVILLQVAMTNS